ncbi:hypothetical protein M427DRAFT_55119 [Gonapodya prolifera JEL478]|uniref:Uncharacterized protein n=1 Tax=Gonapodya prolifera (strain JEL478) TaxID=1344416 RepID=A0A139AJ03_GONPJ|nr:hypothetical protein M427DRAFT_55119 [Gonapodya prolifera JEL478]|eukprot:KXS16782.1 hypothetical protein M427DRAFT_55119 [Gonapodya prolifera JEL478]
MTSLGRHLSLGPNAQPPVPFDNFVVALSPPDCLLINSVESGDANGVAVALRLGANPNVRKRVILGVKVYNKAVRRKSWFNGDEQEKGFGSSETHHKAVLGESALVQAMIRNDVAVVDTLLQAGANVNAEVEWKIIKSRPVWTKEVWRKVQEGSWDVSYKFESALEFALGVGWAFDREGHVSGVMTLNLRKLGDLWINVSGAMVKLKDPVANETLRTVRVKKNPAIVRLLLEHGAWPSKEAVATVARDKDPDMIRVFNEVQQKIRRSKIQGSSRQKSVGW